MKPHPVSPAPVVAPRPRQHLLAHGQTDCGRVRSTNEDAFHVDTAAGLFIVADGMGGGPAGELAAKIVVEILPSLLERRRQTAPNPGGFSASRALTDALIEISEQLYARAQSVPGLSGMGAATVVALIEGTTASIAHLGDCRAYLLRGHLLQRLTKDHSMAQLLVDAGELTDASARKHPLRSHLSRFVGIPGETKPDFTSLNLEPGDRILLCSDGLTGMVDDGQLLKLLNGTEVLVPSCQDLIAAANLAGGRDNITVVLVSLIEE